MGLADMTLMLQAERNRERQEADRQTRLAQERLKALHASEARVAELEAKVRAAADALNSGLWAKAERILRDALKGKNLDD